MPDAERLKARIAQLEAAAGDAVAERSAGERGAGEAEEALRADRLAQARALLEQVRQHEGPQPVAWAVQDHASQAGDARVHQGGNPRRLGDRVPRAFLSVLDETIPEIPAEQSGRLHLAQWIASPENPLTPRVMVNRIWYHHFGRGIVESLNMFGVQGSSPSHPELLDWLAAEFVESGWSLKHMHRLLMATAAYQRSSSSDTSNASRDPENRYLWRYNEQRLEAEAIRDAVLFVSGQLDLRPVSEHPFPEESFKRFSQHAPFNETYDHNHRSVYLMSPRLNRHPFMELFDGPDPNYPTGQRDASTVPLQALYWMNSDFIRENAAAFATRLLENGVEDEALRVRQAFEIALGRPPRDEELAQVLAYLEQLAPQQEQDENAARRRTAWASLARVLFASNEFIYVD